MPVKKENNFVSVLAADLVMAPIFIFVTPHSYQLLILRPRDPVGTGFKIKLSHPCIFRKQMQEALSGNIFWLRISHFLLCNLLKTVNTIGLSTPIFKSWTASTPTTDKHPDVTFLIDSQTWIVMGIIYSLFVIHYGGFANGFPAMIITADHA